MEVQVGIAVAGRRGARVSIGAHHRKAARAFERVGVAKGEPETPKNILVGAKQLPYLVHHGFVRERYACRVQGGREASSV